MRLIKILFCITVFALPSLALANGVNGGLGSDITNLFGALLKPIVDFMAFLFLGGDYEIFGATRNLKIFGFPLLVGWLVIGGVFFTFRLNFVNFKLFGHGIAVVRGKYSSPTDPGLVTHAQAFFTAVSGTVGIGNIGGVALAVTLGGPGAVIWMMIAAFFGMSSKFAEVMMGHKYRRFDKDGHLLAGSWYYLKDGLAEMGYKKLGRFLAMFAAIACIAGAVGAGIMFQSNQAVVMFTDTFDGGNYGRVIFSLVLSLSVGFVLLGGIKRVAHIAEAIVPFMAVLYVSSCVVILFIHSDALSGAIALMFQGAFTGNAAYGGVLGAIIMGFRRAVFSNEAGLGSAPIAHAAAKTKEPVREGAVALLEPFVDTIVICFMTGLVITVTGVYGGSSVNQGGVLITKQAFSTVNDWFPYVLSVAVLLFAYSTMLTYSYYAQQAWIYIFGRRSINICYVTFMIFAFVGGMTRLGVILDFADILLLLMAVPNLFGLYIMSGKIKRETEAYIIKLKRGRFRKT